MRNLFFFFLLFCAAYTASSQSKPNVRQSIINQNTFQGQGAQTTTNGGQNGKLLERAPMTPASASGSKDSSVSNSSPLPSSLRSSPDNVIRIGLLLPLATKNTLDRLYASMNDNEKSKSDVNNKLKNSTQEVLDFYEGIRYALSTSLSKQKIALYVFDTENNDSIVQELMKDDSLKLCDIIIGPTTSNQAKIVSAFCKKNRIINIQPFVASKAFSSENPFLVRFMPTIDAHLQKEYEMVIDSFSDANIIVYTTKKERDLSAARQLDTLFKSYNEINTHKLRYTFVNSGDSSMPVAKRSLTAHILPKEQNVILMTCYDEPVVNSQLRSFRDHVVIFGMPTWIEAEQIRADYLSKSEPFFTDNFYVDTAQSRVGDFVTAYTMTNNQKPSRYSYLGYDAMRYLTVIFDKYGKNIKIGFDNESYDGLGFSFHMSPVIRVSKNSGTPVINYYTNTAMHLFRVSDYKVWLVK